MKRTKNGNTVGPDDKLVEVWKVPVERATEEIKEL